MPTQQPMGDLRPARIFRTMRATLEVRHGEDRTQPESSSNQPLADISGCGEHCNATWATAVKIY
jgi:hypothetical protein